MLTQFEIAKDPAKAALAQEIITIVNGMIEHPEDLNLSDTDLFKQLERPKESKLGDYAMPCFRFAKPLKRKPQDVATEIQEKLMSSSNPWIDKVEVVGAFLNIFIDKSYLAKTLLPSTLDKSFFDQVKNHGGKQDTKVMIEFSQPNTHKEFHVGHGRNVCLGDSLVRMFQYTGHTVTAANYIGDEGTHIAKCLWQMKNFGEPVPENNKAEWYGKRYVEANLKLAQASEDEKKIYEKEISQVLANIESKSSNDYDLWKESREHCLIDFKEIYSWLDVNFDIYFYESEFGEESQEVVDQYLKKGVFQKSDGAIGLNLEDYKLGFCMVRKSDGNIPYMTRDIALADKKFREYKIDKSIYVVASEQKYHFEQLFKTLELMGFESAKDCYHLSYGMVVRPDGKMSSRKGNSITFSDLRKEMLKELGSYLEGYKDQWTEEEIAETAHRLSVGTIKYGMLQSDPSKDIVFNLADWMSFEGDTGPYLMYSYARTQSIIRKGEEKGYQMSQDHLASLTHEAEAELIREIYEFNSTVYQACENYRPSIISHYLFSLCKSFNRFYAEVSVLNAESKEDVSSRLALVQSFANTLKTGLYLLGITPPDKM